MSRRRRSRSARNYPGAALGRDLPERDVARSRRSSTASTACSISSRPRTRRAASTSPRPSSPGTDIGAGGRSRCRTAAPASSRACPQSVTQQGVQRRGSRFRLPDDRRADLDRRLPRRRRPRRLSEPQRARRNPAASTASAAPSSSPRQRAMRIWIDPDKMVGLNLTAGRHQRTRSERRTRRSPPGASAPSRTRSTQQIAATVARQGPAGDAEEFGAIVLRANPDGSSGAPARRRARRGRRRELHFSTRLNGQPSGRDRRPACRPPATRWRPPTAVRAQDGRAAEYLPAGPRIRHPLRHLALRGRSRSRRCCTRWSKRSRWSSSVMFLFLQNFRYTIIPTLVVPVALLGHLRGHARRRASRSTC